MFTKFILRSSSSLPIPLSPPLKPFFFSTATSIRPIAVVTASATASLSATLPYEPSLSNGHHQHPSPHLKTLHQDKDDNNDEFDETSFTRVFDVAALRVSADRCYALESQLRGHLLNWPRVRNIARVPGDEIDSELQKYFNNSSDKDDESLESLNRRIYGKAEGDGERLSPVLYRDKLAKTFNARGYEKFRNLAKLSRPKRKAKKKEGSGVGEKEKTKNECYLLEEVVDDDDRRIDEEDLSGLIGEAEYRLGKWKGSTRLLLLDHRHADKSVDELPEAVKVVVTSYLLR